LGVTGCHWVSLVILLSVYLVIIPILVYPIN